MADPLSFVASITAVLTLAESVVTKGHRYIKAVKDCPDEVRGLIAEASVLCAVLDRITNLLKGRKPTLDKPDTTGSKVTSSCTDTIDDDPNVDESSESDDQGQTSQATLEIPEFIYECQRTLEEIQNILRGFARSSTSETDHKMSRYKLSTLQQLKSKDLSWPLSKSKTLGLMQKLERHKNTCTLALTGCGLSDIHKIIMESARSNACLAKIRAQQEKIIEFQLNEKEEKILEWLSPVNPTIKHRTFRRERHPGTGTWLFDLPEMTHWLENPTGALWIYGIPGAGKTTLSTLVVDEILTRKRSNTIGTAYFYVRHDDKRSHNPVNFLGSIIAQLARQKPEALKILVEMYSSSLIQGTSTPEEQVLEETLGAILSKFAETYIMIDGLDESGSLYDQNRCRLVNVVGKLHDYHEGSVRVLVLSRDEQDIREHLTQGQFQTVSIAARSADLRLFVNAWLGRLEIRSKRLRSDVVDTLVEKADGMFMWVRAQVDYLQRLPNDAEKRAALKRLPPDLPQTYVRIFETIHRSYPPQTIRYIQRVLKWLVLAEPTDKDTRPEYSELDTILLQPEMLCQLIAIENVIDWPTADDSPTPEQVFLGIWLAHTKLRFDKEPERPHGDRKRHSLQMAKLLVEFGADVNRPSLLRTSGVLSDGLQVHIVTPLELALICRNWEVLTLLLDSGAAWNIKALGDDLACLSAIPFEVVLSAPKSVPLEDVEYIDLEWKYIVACIAKDGRLYDLPNTLKAWRFDINSREEYGCSISNLKESSPIYQDAFKAAFSKGDWQEVERLLLKEPHIGVDDVNENGWAAIHYASKYNDDAVKLLLEHGARTDTPTFNQETAICIAACNGKVTCIQLLHKYGVDLDQPEAQGRTPLLASIAEGQLEVFRFLLGGMVNVNARLDNGKGALHIAIENRTTAVIPVLIRRKVDCLRPDNYGTTPLHLACIYGFAKLSQELLQTSEQPVVAVNSHSLHFGTPLYASAGSGYTSVVNFLLDHGATIDLTGPGNHLGSALMGACSEGCDDVVRALLSRGAALEVKEARFESAEGTARAFRKEGIVKILEEHRRTGVKGKERDLIDRSQQQHDTTAKDVGEYRQDQMGRITDMIRERSWVGRQMRGQKDKEVAGYDLTTDGKEEGKDCKD
ncbi:MAG: hypothetical protein Q9219_006132 [cf. Caloplaca sp. 3 TL-2023]